MPALLPVCANLYKVGAYTKDGNNINKLLVDSPDGLIKIDHNFRNEDNCCEHEFFGFNNDNISIEVKNPYPQPQKLPVHHKLPKWYILQVLIHMVVTDCQVNWYACGGPKSIVLIECLFDEDLWENIWSKMKTFLDKAKPAAMHWMKQLRETTGTSLTTTSKKKHHCWERFLELKLRKTASNSCTLSDLVPITNLRNAKTGLDPILMSSEK